MEEGSTQLVAVAMVIAFVADFAHIKRSSGNSVIVGVIATKVLYNECRLHCCTPAITLSS